MIAQQAIEKKGFESHEWSRTIRMSGFGGFVAGPVLSTWYRFAELNIKGSTPLAGTLILFTICNQLTCFILALVKKVAADQLLFAPTFIAGTRTQSNLSLTFAYHKSQGFSRLRDFLKENHLWRSRIS